MKMEPCALVLEARKLWWEIVEMDEGECRMMGIIRELADEIERLRRPSPPALEGWPYPDFTLDQIDEAVLANDDISVALTEVILTATKLARLSLSERGR